MRIWVTFRAGARCKIRVCSGMLLRIDGPTIEFETPTTNRSREVDSFDWDKIQKHFLFFNTGIQPRSPSRYPGAVFNTTDSVRSVVPAG